MSNVTDRLDVFFETELRKDYTLREGDEHFCEHESRNMYVYVQDCYCCHPDNETNPIKDRSLGWTRYSICSGCYDSMLLCLDCGGHYENICVYDRSTDYMSLRHQIDPDFEHNDYQKVLKSLAELRLNDWKEIKKMTPDELQRIYPDHNWIFEYPHLATKCNHCDVGLERDECLARYFGMFCVCLDCFDLYYDETNVKGSLKTLYHATRNKNCFGPGKTCEVEGEWNEGMRKTRLRDN